MAANAPQRNREPNKKRNIRLGCRPYLQTSSNPGTGGTKIFEEWQSAAWRANSDNRDGRPSVYRSVTDFEL
jgi:hypothetical protein